MLERQCPPLFPSIIEAPAMPAPRRTARSRCGRPPFLRSSNVMTRRFTLIALVALLAGAAAGAGQAQQPAQTAGQPAQSAPSQTPTFKVQVDYVDVDVLVTDKEGRFVRDLKKE